MSRIPPFMRPAKVRDLLAPYGEVGRIYLKPEGTGNRTNLLFIYLLFNSSNMMAYFDLWKKFNNKIG
jgi:ESF2/ABP1 family protein